LEKLPISPVSDTAVVTHVLFSFVAQLEELLWTVLQIYCWLLCWGRRRISNKGIGQYSAMVRCWLWYLVHVAMALQSWNFL